MSYRRLLVAVPIATAALVFAAPAQAAAPLNNNFGAAETISGTSVNVVGTTVEATAEGGEPNHAGAGASNPSVWYSWLAPSSGTVKLDTCGTTADTSIGVYTGASVNALTASASNDDSANPACPGPNFESRTRFRAESGTTYKIAVASASGTGPFDLQLDLVTPPANDDFANGQDLTGATVNTTGSTSNASRETGEPQHLTSQQNGASIWFDWTAPSTGPYRISTCGSDYNTNLAVYTGASLGTLTPVLNGRNNDFCGQQSAVQIEVTAAQVYRIAVDGHEQTSFRRGDPASGAVSLAIRALNPPGNDNFGAATTISGIPVTQAGTSLDATAEPGETPADARSVWYSWEAPSTGPVSVSTCGAETLIDVFTGNAVNALTPVTATSTTCDDGSRKTFAATDDTVYRFRVRDAGAQGPFDLRLRGASTPSNDLLEGATALTGLEPTLSDDNIASTGDVFGAATHTVWYSWTPPAGDYRVSACNANFVSGVGVYTGSTVGTLENAAEELFACENSNFTGVEFSTDGIEPVRIVVAGGTGAAPEEGEFTLETEQFVRPPNDDFANAFAMSGTTATSTGITPDASAEPNEPTATPDSTNSNWHSWTAPSTGEYRLSTCESDPFTLTYLAVYTGTALSNLEEQQVDFNGPYCGNSEEQFGAKLIFDAQAGTTYWFQVLSSEDEPELEGAYKLDLSPSGVTNDAPDTAIDEITVKKKSATATFSGTDDGTGLTFECNVDGKGWNDCVSPQKFKRLTRGTHSLAVRAIDAEGKLDRTPAADTFKVKKKKN